MKLAGMPSAAAADIYHDDHDHDHDDVHCYAYGYVYHHHANDQWCFFEMIVTVILIGHMIVTIFIAVVINHTVS